MSIVASIHGDTRAVLVSPNGDSGSCKIDETLDTPAIIWRDLTSWEDIEMQIIVRNKSHPQQTTREKGVTTGPLMNDIQVNPGLSATADDLLTGKFVTDYKVSEEMAAGIEQTGKRTHIQWWE